MMACEQEASRVYQSNGSGGLDSNWKEREESRFDSPFTFDFVFNLRNTLVTHFVFPLNV